MSGVVTNMKICSKELYVLLAEKRLFDCSSGAGQGSQWTHGQHV